MDMLSLVYTLSAVIGGGFLVGLKTKNNIICSHKIINISQNHGCSFF